MRRSTAQLHSMNDLVTGNRLILDAALQTLVLDQLERLLDTEVRLQNRLLYCPTVKGLEMKEVRDLAAGMKDIIANLRKTNIDAKSGLMAEVGRSQTNASKVKSFTQELKAANLEVESFLGETGSNFPSSEDLNTPAVPHADINGVTLNSEAIK